MKHDIDIKITKNSEEKINEFDAQDYLNKYVQSGETNQVEEDKENIILENSDWIRCGIWSMGVIVGVNLISDILQNFVVSFKLCNINVSVSFFKISPQTNVLAVLLVVLLIINELFKKKK
ncbi:hypothetical protein K1J07_02320 [Streptococcus gordonii]|uniref:hypothetical protein n=1 Tax=Streptococcus gordonii TaxID=1302 RepID=UPI0005F35508|nr:hypothetical protein [Streptococcus gordonii]KJU96922.1 hypothetical protein UA00_01161 [Streptococcus gordonii]MBZ2131156.1 hypothetical protein [Streptococcus gordonii]MBZ2147532.1 hypothetical protein [Streptococcus gordonii]